MSVLVHLCSASVLSCGVGSSTAGEKDTSACGVQLVTAIPVMTPKQYRFLRYVQSQMLVLDKCLPPK